MGSNVEEELQEILNQEGGMRAVAQYLEDAGYTVRLGLSAFRIPVLVSLYEMGGRGEVPDVLRRVERKLRFRLTSRDYTVICSNGRSRWEDYTHWSRNELREEGLIASGSQYGVWDLTQKGIEEAERLSS